MKNKRESLKYRGTECLNCGVPLDVSEKFCPNCGQLNSTKKLTFEDFFHEYFSGIFAYDSRLIKTLTTLLFHPGKISLDYVKGKRQRYANPYKFYLSVSIIFFLMWGYLPNNDTAVPVRLNAEKTIEETAEESAGAEAILPDSIADDEKEKELQDLYLSEAELDSMELKSRLLRKMQIFYSKFQESKITEPGIALAELDYQPTRFNRWLYKKMVDTEEFSSHPEVFWNYISGKLPFIIFFFLPFFTLFIWLLYFRRSFSYMEHLIFAFHTQTCWFFLYGIALILESFISGELPTTIANMTFLFYLYKALRKFYAQPHLNTIIKFIILNIIFLILAVIAGGIFIIASFALY